MQATIETARNALVEMKKEEAEDALATAKRKVEQPRKSKSSTNDAVSDEDDEMDDEAQLLLYQHRSLDTKVLGRRCIYYHHILSSYKRCFIQNAARRLELRGFCKVGYPGILIVEGCEEACELYVQLLQRLRWKLMVVRGEEKIPSPDGYHNLRNITAANLQTLFGTQGNVPTSNKGKSNAVKTSVVHDSIAVAKAEAALTSRPVWETDSSEEIARWCAMCELSVLFRTVMKIYA